MKTSFKNRTTIIRKSKVLIRENKLGEQYEMSQGYPTLETIEKVYDNSDLNGAVQAYKFFYTTVSGAAIIF